MDIEEVVVYEFEVKSLIFVHSCLRNVFHGLIWNHSWMKTFSYVPLWITAKLRISDCIFGKLRLQGTSLSFGQWVKNQMNVVSCCNHQHLSWKWKFLSSELLKLSKWVKVADFWKDCLTLEVTDFASLRQEIDISGTSEMKVGDSWFWGPRPSRSRICGLLN